MSGERWLSVVLVILMLAQFIGMSTFYVRFSRREKRAQKKHEEAGTR